MKTIILAGGLGTRFSEETENKPKPMILIDDRPILWHIMNIYASQGYDDFVIATGYKSEIIEDWVSAIKSPWKISTVDTGLRTQTGGRIKQCIKQLEGDVFFTTYGDGLGNVNLEKLLNFHRSRGAVVTATAVRPTARFGYIEERNGKVTKFGEKNQVNEGWINGGFFVINRSATEFIGGDDEPFETGALPKLTQKRQFYAFKHEGFWFPMDTRSEQQELRKLAKLDTPPWQNFLND